jgi:DNA-directed RNA polymerase subunit K/omega
MTEKHEFSKYERARILGARSLQISMDAPLLIKVEGEELENLNYDPLKIAQKELDSGVLPITVSRPMPIKRDEKLKELKMDEVARQEEKERRRGEESEEDTEEVSPEDKMKEVAVELKSDEEMEEEEMEGDGLGAGGVDEDESEE